MPARPPPSSSALIAGVRCFGARRAEVRGWYLITSPRPSPGRRGGWFQFLRDRGAQQRKHDLVVAGELVAAAAAECWPLDHVDVRSILAQEVHVDGDQLPDPLADVAREVERLQ